MNKVYLDPGHGGSDPGAVGHGLREKDLTLKIAQYTRDSLQSNYSDVQVKLSRIGDTYPSLNARTNDANRWGADVFISIHINSFNGVAHGYEDFIYNRFVRNTTSRLQDAVHNEVAPLFRNNRGQKRANFAVLRESNMPAILTENGFIDNRRDADFLRNDANLRKIGEAHAEGIAAYFGLRQGSSGPASASTSASGILYRVRESRNNARSQIGAFRNLDNAKGLADEHGYHVYDDKGNLVYHSSSSSGTSNTSSNLIVDGYWGTKTTSALQRYFGIQVDGVISDQYQTATTRRITSGITWGTTGSTVIRALQSHIGAVVDGLLGPETIRKLQAHLGTVVDGEIWWPSRMVMEMQRRLNSGSL